MKIVSSEELSIEFYSYTEPEEISTVKKIIKDVKKDGDKALDKYSKEFDSTIVKEISSEDIKNAYENVDPELIESIKKAYENIKVFAEKQYSSIKGFEIKRSYGVLGQKLIPIEKVGCYVPGGRYPLLSSALMSIVPAKVAGVKEIIVCSPKIHDAVIVAADIAGADRIFNVGGVQGIAALAYGTSTIPAVDKIVGPGNKFVTAAKKEVYGKVGIDLVAGPSEVLIIADSHEKEVAIDLIAQAEHDTNARSYLLTLSKEFASKVNDEIDKILLNLDTKDTAKEALGNGLIIVCKDIDEVIDIANKKAPEHLEVIQKEEIIDKLKNYGSLFIDSPVVFGDYCSGTNHTLPTNLSARYTGGLGVKDFLKIVTYQKITSSELVKISSKMAYAEGLSAHKKSALRRGKKIEDHG